MSSIILALADLGAAMPMQEALERDGHQVQWDGESRKGPSSASLEADVVMLDAEDEESVAAASAWRDHDPPPALLFVGTSAAGQSRAEEARCAFVPMQASASDINAQLQAVLAVRFAGRMSPAYARAALGLGPAVDPDSDTVRIVGGSRQVDVGLVTACLRWHACEYVTGNERIAKLRELRALEHPEIEVARLLDGTRTVQTLVSAENGVLAGRLLWALISSGAASTSAEPIDSKTPERRQLIATRDHLRARQQRLEHATHYDVLEVGRHARPELVDYAARALALRFSPTHLKEQDLGDLRPVADALWEQILVARSVLMDAIDRANYDDAIDARADQLRSPWAFEVRENNDAENHFRQAQAHLVAGDAFKAVSAFAATCRAHPEQPDYEAYLCWARYRAELSRGKEGSDIVSAERKKAEEWLVGRRPWPRALVALAFLCAADGDPEAARFHLHEALRVNPNLPAAKQLLGRIGRGQA